MKPSSPTSRSYSFGFPRLDTVVEVKAGADRVVIHASRDTFSRDRKECFLRELAAEGFIAEECAVNWATVHWIVDPAEFMPDPAQRAQTNRFVRRLFAATVAVWLSLMASLFLHAVR